LLLDQTSIAATPPAGGEPDPTATGRARRGRWQRGAVEAIVLFIVYQGFEWVRGLVAGSADRAQRNALQVIKAEQHLSLFHEAAVQRWFLPYHRVIEAWDIYYGTIHFVVPVLALFLLWRWTPGRYRHHLNALALATVLGLIGFWLYPLAPPRLLPAHYGFVDTAARIGGMGPFDSGSMRDTGNLFAAMPSLHLAWSTWCAVVLVPLLHRPWQKALAIAYPVITLAAVVITGNHYVLDGVGGLIVLALGWALASAFDRRRRAKATSVNV
jgi:hypothetical protein